MLWKSTVQIIGEKKCLINSNQTNLKRSVVSDYPVELGTSSSSFFFYKHVLASIKFISEYSKICEGLMFNGTFWMKDDFTDHIKYWDHKNCCRKGIKVRISIKNKFYVIPG